MKLSFDKTNLLKRIGIQVLVWVGIVSLVFLFNYYSERGRRPEELNPDLKYHFLGSIFLLIGIFYAFSTILIPRFFKRSSVVIFLLFVIGCGFLYAYGVNLLFRQMQHSRGPAHTNSGKNARPPAAPNFNTPPPSWNENERKPPPPGNGPLKPPPNSMEFIQEPMNSNNLPYTVTLLPYVLTVTASIAFRYLRNSQKLEIQLKEEQMSAITAQLTLLKSQVSPHFLFNTLNNFSYLARIQSPILETSLLKLSSILRYMLYETAAEHVQLDKEIEYLEDYISLQEMRNQDINVRFELMQVDEHLMIAPMLLIPFVENAFKYAHTVNNPAAFINIYLKTEKQRLEFEIINSFQDIRNEHTDRYSGIGLQNVQKRLQLLYPQKHVLKIEKKEPIFHVKLKIDLN